MIFKFRNLLRDKSGATAIEYGLIAALVSVAAVVALQNLGTSLNTMFTTVATQLDTAVAVGGAGTEPPFVGRYMSKKPRRLPRST